MSAAGSAVGLLAAERIKLGSVRSPWWCAGLAVLGVVGLTSIAVLTEPDQVTGGNPFLQLGLVVVLVLAAVAVTTEYRYSTIRSTFAAVPVRSAALLAKAVVVAVVCGVVGLLAAAGSQLAIGLLATGGGPDVGGIWWTIVGAGGVFAAGALLALGIGLLVRHTAAALSILLVWVLLGEQLISAIPAVGPDIARWLPFMHAMNALVPGIEGLPFGPGGSLAYFAAICAGIFGAGLLVAGRRDA